MLSSHAHARTMENTQITLAPQAGAGLGKILFDRLLAESDFIDLMVQAARDGLKAMSPRRWDKESQTWIADPDAKTRVQTLFGLIAQAEGDPVKRVIHQHLAQAGADPLTALQESPELREAARKMLANAEWKHSGTQAHKRPKKVEAVEAEAKPADKF